MKFSFHVSEEVYILSYSYVFTNLQRFSGQKGDATAYIKVYIFFIFTGSLMLEKFQL